ncbi:hypothetical protein [Flavihumibacter sp. UBA7668]|uniref:hypothetical protein n=1 Tax=Flavihumibacter sp. UBA7668 TaxID=1946542 RepID=UPI0025BD8170|nr:hypothetical protein [Flavihumibacter sp. UBA7668]
MKKWSWVFLLICHFGMAQKRWTGNNGTAYWNDPLNWEGDTVPGSTDQVLLDNSFFSGSYEVILPDEEIVVASLEVSPSDNRFIRLLLPISNTFSSAGDSPLPRAFTTLGSGYSLHLRKNAAFINASGSASGYALRISDSIRIDNGAQYIHRSRTGHADMVNQLSRISGTEYGVFRMENPDAASTFSISGRVFGSLELSSSASSSGTTTYSSSGTNPVVIRGNLELDSGTMFSLHFDDTIQLHGNLKMNYAVLNMSTGNRSSCVALRGNWEQIQSRITESNSSGHSGTILLNGKNTQFVQSDGWNEDSIRIVVDNSAGIQLYSNWKIPYELSLKKGIIETGSYLLEILHNARILSDPDMPETGISGTVWKGFLLDDNMIFPLIKGNAKSSINVRNFKGSIRLSYHLDDANIPGQYFQSGLASISSLEYWEVDAQPDATSPDPVFEFSYASPQSGSINNAVELTIASYLDDQWSVVGDGLTLGSDNSKGSVQTIALSEEQLMAKRYTLANKTGGSNVLPILLESSWLSKSMQSWELNWIVSSGVSIAEFQIESAADGQHFRTIATVLPMEGKRKYEYRILRSQEGGVYRIKIITENQQLVYGNGLKLPSNEEGSGILAFLVPMSSSLILSSNKADRFVMELFNSGGQLLERKSIWQPAGIATHLVSLPSGRNQLIILKLTNSSGSTTTIKQFW